MNEVLNTVSKTKVNNTDNENDKHFIAVYYAIVHVPTGAFLPQIHQNRGYTSHDPSITRPPRLFTTRRAASVALTWWLRGKHGIDYYYGANEDGPVQKLECEPVPTRVKDDMAIVEMRLMYSVGVV